MMPRFPSFAAFALLLGPVGLLNAQTTLILPPSRDVVVGYHDNYNSANTNYNSSWHCSAISQPGTAGGVNKCRGMMDFDLSSIPADATVLGAFLSLSASGPVDNLGYVTSVGSMGLNACKLVRITSAWNDNTVTWNTQPTTSAVNAVSLAQSSYTLQNYLNIDVTALVQDMVAAPGNSHGFMLKLDNETPSRGLCVYGGLAPQPDKRPSLVVVYGECGSSYIGEFGGGGSGLVISPSITGLGGTVRLDMDPMVHGKTDLVLHNALGQVVDRRPVASWPVSLPVPALAPGTYTWLVQSPDGKVMGMARMVVR